MRVRVSGFLVTVTDARSNQDAERKDEGRNKERVFCYGLANLLQNNFSLGAFHAKDLLDFIVRIVAFLCFMCHVYCHTQSLRYPRETRMGASLIYIAVTKATNPSLISLLNRGISLLAYVNTIRSGDIFSLFSHDPVKRSHLKS